MSEKKKDSTMWFKIIINEFAFRDTTEYNNCLSRTNILCALKHKIVLYTRAKRREVLKVYEASSRKFFKFRGSEVPFHVFFAGHFQKYEVKCNS